MIKLYEILKNRKRFAIAFSGGVDSTFLAAVSRKICSNKVIALTAVSKFQSEDELKKSVEIAKNIGIKQFMIPVDVISDPAIVINSRDRCYFCKKKLFESLKSYARELGFDLLAHGANIDDLKDYRPGLKAAQEIDIFSPLVEAQMDKKTIRSASKEMGLSTWDIPSQSCLATRIPYGDIITVEKLAQIEICEHFLTQLGFSGIRVRCYSDMARIECSLDDITQITQNDIRAQIISFFKASGFKFVSLDLAGYISGNMN